MDCSTQVSLSIKTPRACSNSCPSIGDGIHHLMFCHPLLLHSIFRSITVFKMSQFFRSSLLSTIMMVSSAYIDTQVITWELGWESLSSVTTSSWEWALSCLIEKSLSTLSVPILFGTRYSFYEGQVFHKQGKRWEFGWFHRHIWSYWYFSQQSWFQLVLHPAWHFTWCTLHIKLYKQGDNIQPWRTPFPIWNQSVVPCPALTVDSWPVYRFLRRQVRWSGIPISWRIFHSFFDPHGQRLQHRQ